MATVYYVKAYYTKRQQQQPEIRRFAIDISPENDIYQELCTKVATYQPDIQLTGFTLQYIDEESERITFSSNEELRSAIAANLDSNPLKIFVTANQQDNSSDQECHTGVECDGCKGSVTGSRFKCVTCPNFDLCEKCSAAGVHAEHNMIKISKPGNLYHPYGSRHHGGGGRRFHPRHMSPPRFMPGPELIEQVQAQIPHWLPNRESTAHIRAHVQEHLESLKTNTQSHVHNSKQYLENVGQYLQTFLSPYGIDCDYRVDGERPSATTESTASSTEPKTANDQQQAGISSWMNMFRTTGSNPSTTSATTTSNEASDKAIGECIEKMKAMGFTEANEELMALIRSKKGDLNSVLDEINSRRHAD